MLILEFKEEIPWYSYQTKLASVRLLFYLCTWKLPNSTRESYAEPGTANPATTITAWQTEPFTKDLNPA